MAEHHQAHGASYLGPGLAACEPSTLLVLPFADAVLLAAIGHPEPATNHSRSTNKSKL